MKDSTSNRQQRILDFVRDYVRQHGYPPSNREIGKAMGGLSTSVVKYNLERLMERGLLGYTHNVSRGLSLPERPASHSRLITLPVIGRIAAGAPIEAVQNPEETIDLPANLAPENGYVLRVKGQSMIDDLIDDGDLVVIRPQETADNGDTVVALLLNGPSETGEATLKRFYREQDRIRLQPRNETMSPIYARPEDVRIQGKVVAVVRPM